MFNIAAKSDLLVKALTTLTITSSCFLRPINFFLIFSSAITFIETDASC